MNNYSNYNKNEIYNACKFTGMRPFNIENKFSKKQMMKSLKDVDGIVDVVDVRLVNKRGVNYSDFELNIRGAMSSDKRRLLIPFDSIWEIKYPNIDIRGTTK